MPAWADEFKGLGVKTFRMFIRNLGCMEGQRAVHVYWDMFQLSRHDQLIKALHQFLGAANRESRDDYLAMACNSIQNSLVRLTVGFTWVSMDLIAIDTFQPEKIRVVWHNWIAQDGQPVLTYFKRELEWVLRSISCSSRRIAEDPRICPTSINSVVPPGAGSKGRV